MGDQNLKLALLRHHATALVIGAIIGAVSRLTLTAQRTNEQILSSPLGLVAFCCIGGGITGIISGWQRRRPIRYYVSLTTLVVGIMWVIPFAS